jgi:hypothetical protein
VLTIERLDRKASWIIESVKQAGKPIGIGSLVHQDFLNRSAFKPKAGLPKAAPLKQRRQSLQDQTWETRREPQATARG